MPKLKWTVEFEVADNWVADGFELDDDRALEMIATELGWASTSELGAKVIAKPNQETIRGLQSGRIDPEY